MLSKSCRSLNKRCSSLGLETPHNRSREKAAQTCRTKGIAKMDNQSKPKTKKDNGKTEKYIGKWCEFYKSP
jgi:hypothetical protein